MKAIKILNTIAVGIPIMLMLIGIIKQDSAGEFIGYALFSTMFTGFVQVMLGLSLLRKFPENIHYQIYIVAVVLFFVLWFIVHSFDLYDFGYLLLWIPPCLAVYLSILIYSRTNNEF
ncbi:hypothetical protein [Paenimyroides baculatum]|uniref:Uncharacterized protein n=1 Tax=Paenimyroides baculatum TaxID=2608000 RepID=A0A5M6C9Z4_9FLAO|nr:hypothetical protein [Paenimyroides baculatum]KAA5531863.1 hypothetical protein F0460_14690 [Paenimyroides baculatum]